MRKQDATILACCGGLASFALAYTLRAGGPVYLPLRHAWAWSAAAGEIGMGWYAKLGFSMLVALVVYGALRATFACKGNKNKPAGNRAVFSATAGVLLVWLWAAACLVWQQLAHL